MSADYPQIEEAISMMAYDNGVIHRGNTVEKVKDRVLGYLKTKFEIKKMQFVESWLAGLDADAFEELCIGETDQLLGVPPDVEELLNEAFEAL